jgi:hypothetical protein
MGSIALVGVTWIWTYFGQTEIRARILLKLGGGIWTYFGQTVLSTSRLAISTLSYVTSPDFVVGYFTKPMLVLSLLEAKKGLADGRTVRSLDCPRWWRGRSTRAQR